VGGELFIQPDPEFTSLIRKLFECYTTGQYSLLEVSREACDEGLGCRNTKRKKPKSVVHKILKNPLTHRSLTLQKARKQHFQ